MVIINSIQEKIVRRKIAREGGERSSELLRKQMKEKYHVDVGMYSYGGCFEKCFNVGGEVIIGRYCSFGSGVHYYGGNHPMSRVSMSPYFYKQDWANSVRGGITVDDIERHKLTIGHDCWIGANVIITSSCHYIGNGAVIGAGSVVTKDIEAYTVNVGVPARTIRMRFTADQIERLEESKWFDYEPEDLLEWYKYINNPILFCEKIDLLRK